MKKLFYFLMHKKIFILIMIFIIIILYIFMLMGTNHINHNKVKESSLSFIIAEYKDMSDSVWVSPFCYSFTQDTTAIVCKIERKFVLTNLFNDGWIWVNYNYTIREKNSPTSKNISKAYRWHIHRDSIFDMWEIIEIEEAP